MTLNVLHRRYSMPVRQYHRETLACFSERVLSANGESEKHRDHLIRLATTSLRADDKQRAWLNILRTKTGRADLQLMTPLRTHTVHDDNEVCRHCHRKTYPLRNTVTIPSAIRMRNDTNQPITHCQRRLAAKKYPGKSWKIHIYFLDF